MRLLGLALLLAIFAGPASQARPAPAPDPAACAVFAADVALFHKPPKDPLFLRPGPPIDVRNSVRKQDRWLSEAPSADLLDRYLSSKPVNPVDLCPAAARKMLKAGVVIDDARAEALFNTWLFGPKTPGLIGNMEGPVLSEDGRSALMFRGVGCGRVCGSAWLVHYRKTRAGWKPVGQLSLGNS